MVESSPGCGGGLSRDVTFFVQDLYSFIFLFMTAKSKFGVGTEEPSACCSHLRKETSYDDLELSTDPIATQPFTLEKIHVESFKKAKIYKKKKKLNGSPILRQEIRPIKKLWVLNIRFKSVRHRHQPICKSPYLLTKIHSHGRVDIKDSTNEFKCTIQVNPYLPLSYDTAKEWLILKGQVAFGDNLALDIH
ncbi:hypothetical protein DVH24_030126 [Malus domestica]|uniref:Uncharacterized protein n=1 Tax=Malus domestica TaxID=3750 RepID=A0A498I0H7_MALDO|nr:hypothetical protein DVH24_030126 [Malus domestica]